MAYRADLQPEPASGRTDQVSPILDLQLPADGSVFLYEHQYTDNLDGLQFLLWTRVSSVWPQLRTLGAVRTAAFNLLTTSLRFKPHHDHAKIVTKEASIGEQLWHLDLTRQIDVEETPSR